MEAMVIIGGGGHAKVVLSVLKKLNRYQVAGYTALEASGSFSDLTYLGGDEGLATAVMRHGALNVVIAVGQTSLGTQRCKLGAEAERLGCMLPALVSPDAIVNQGVVIGEAVVVMDGAVINCDAVVGRGAIVNTNSTIEHDVWLEDWVHVAPGATVCGGARIGRFSLVGAGATILPGIKIKEGCVIGAGATVVQHINEAGVYAGCPARRLKKD